MAQIEKIQNVMVDNKIDRVVMSIKDGEKVVEGEVYLAFVDTNTNKRYMIYTTEKAKSENDRIPFSLSTLVYENNSYVLEETSKEDHDKIEIPILNVIGMKAKTSEEAEQLLQKEFPSIAVVSVQPLIDNVQNRMVISEKKPPKKASMPMVVANVIKKYYLYQLNKELDKVYSNVDMTETEKKQTIQKLDKIENKLDSLKGVYEENTNQDKVNHSIEKSLDEIEIAKQDIAEAKNHLEQDTASIEENESLTAGEEKLPEVKLEDHLKDEVAKILEEEKVESPVAAIEPVTQNIPDEPVNTPLQDQNSVEPSMDPSSRKNENLEEPSASTQTITEQPLVVEQVEEKEIKNQPSKASDIEVRVQKVIDQSIESFAANLEQIVNEIRNGIGAIYQEQISADKKTIEQLKAQLQEQTEKSQQERMNLIGEIKKLGEKATTVNEQAIQSKKTVEGLEQKLTVSTQNEEKLRSEKEDLTTQISSQKQQLDQQNRLIDSLREESNTRDQKHQEENNKLQEENNKLQEENAKSQEEIRSLRRYKEGYEQMKSLFDRVQQFQNPVKDESSTVDQVVEEVIGQSSPQK
ncbi:MAG: hypothetical protein MR388_03220 [Tenericutes bacterium]|nr:hypothetical protein [Mycoplasmatota bacterium]